jgi:hypothetical protein
MPTEDSPRLDDFEAGLPETLPPAGINFRQRRVRTTIAVLAVVVLLLGFGQLLQRGRLPTAGGTGAISGEVVWPDGRPLQATVIVVGAGMHVETDAEGRFELRRVPAGAQGLVVGYRGAGYEVPITVVRGEMVDIGRIRFISTLEPDA